MTNLIQQALIRGFLLVSLLLFSSIIATSAWARSSHESVTKFSHGQSLNYRPVTDYWLADSDRDFRTKADVMREIKTRYDARVLKISLNKKREVYQVRLLMPNGKVRNITVNARR